MAKKLIHDFRMLVPQGPQNPQRVQIDGVWTRIVFFGSTSITSPNVYFDGALAVSGASDVPTVYDWPAVRDSDGTLLQYDTYVDITDDRGPGNDPFGFIITARLVDRP